MNPSSIAVTPGNGVNLDSVNVSGKEREVTVIGDPTTALAIAAVTATAPDPDDYGVAVREVGQKIWATGFADVGSSVLDANFSLRTAGTGIGYSQAAGSLLITSGTTANSEFLARSTVAWQGALLLKFTSILSQRIAQNNFQIMLADKIGEGLACVINSTTSVTITIPGSSYSALNVGQFMMIGGISGAAGVPGRYAIASVSGNAVTFTVAGWPASGSCTVDLFGHSYIRNLYTATTATQMSFDTQRKGWADAATTATINTSASPGHLVQTSLDGRNVFMGDVLTASSTTPITTTRASRFTNIPDDTLDLYAYIWVNNGTTNPATTTTWTIGQVVVENLANNPVMLAGNRMQGTQAPMPVSIASIISGTLPLVTTVTTLTNITNWGNLVDNALFTDGTTRLSMDGFIFDDVAGTALTENDAAAARVDSKRAQTMVIEDATTRGQKMAVSAAGAIDVRQVGAYSFNNITTNATTVVKGSAGTFRGLTVNTAGTGSTATIYDNTAGSGTKVGTVNTAVLGTSLQFDAACATGITIVTAGAGAADITAMFL